MFLKRINVITRVVSFLIFLIITIIEKNTYFLLPILLLCIYSSIDHENLFISILNFLLFIPIFFYKLKYIAEIKLGLDKDLIYKLLHKKEELKDIKNAYKLSFNNFYKKSKLYIEFTKADIIFLILNTLYLLVVIFI